MIDSRNESGKKPGHYLGTEIDGKWWRRYRQEGFFARGNGEWRYDGNAFYFEKYPGGGEITIPWQTVIEFESGRWHAGRWAGGLPVVKIFWQKEGQWLSSGFLLSNRREEVENILSRLKQMSKEAKEL